MGNLVLGGTERTRLTIISRNAQCNEVNRKAIEIPQPDRILGLLLFKGLQRKYIQTHKHTDA